MAQTRLVQSGPKVLLYDIETSHNIVAKFSLYDDGYTPYENIIQERFIICGAWMWLGKPKIHTVTLLDDPARFKKDHADDLHVTRVLNEAMAEADVIVTHNGDKFDNRYVKARSLVHGLPPIPPFRSIDTLKIAKANFNLNCNRLDYIAGQVLKVGRKIETRKGLWLEVLKGNTKAIQEMSRYNKGDVTVLRDVFLKFRPFIPDYVNRQLYGGETNACPRCGSHHYQSRGTHVATTRTYRRFQCQDADCMGWFRGQKSNASVIQYRPL